MAGPQRSARNRIARERGGNRGSQARTRPLAEGVERRGGQAEAIGKADEPLARAHMGRKVCNRQCASRFDLARFHLAWLHAAGLDGISSGKGAAIGGCDDQRFHALVPAESLTRGGRCF